MSFSISILVSKVKEDRVQTIIERLTVMTSGKDDVRDIASLGEGVPMKDMDDYVSVRICNCIANRALLCCSPQDRGPGDTSRIEARQHRMHKARSQNPSPAQKCE